MSMLDGVSQCWWLSTTCAADWPAWGAIATAAVGAATVAVAVLAWRTSRQAAKIALEQNLRAEALRNETAEIIGKMLTSEVSLLPGRIGGMLTVMGKTVVRDEAIRISHSDLDWLVTEISEPFLPSAVDIQASLHTLPAGLGGEIAGLIGQQRMVALLIRRFSERINKDNDSDHSVRAGDAVKDFSMLKSILRSMLKGSLSTGSAFAEFAKFSWAEHSCLHEMAAATD